MSYSSKRQMTSNSDPQQASQRLTLSTTASCTGRSDFEHDQNHALRRPSGSTEAIGTSDAEPAEDGVAMGTETPTVIDRKTGEFLEPSSPKDCSTGYQPGLWFGSRKDNSKFAWPPAEGTGAADQGQLSSRSSDQSLQEQQHGRED